MKDIQELINKILSKANVANISDDDKSETSAYHSEPILKPASEIIAHLPYKYREMRKIKTLSSYYNHDAQLFYEQGKFMEDFEDDFEYTGEFIHYFPTYQAMNDNQLRGYFSWRSKLRRGDIVKTSLSYVFVYIYELLNQIGTSSPQDGFIKMIEFWEAYKEIEPAINRYLNIWIIDYVIYYNLDTGLLSPYINLENDNNLQILINYTNHTPKEVTEALNHFSNYNILKSKFYLQYTEDVDTVVYHVYHALTEYYKNYRKNSLNTKLFGVISLQPYNIFNNAIFFKKEKMEDRVVCINSVNKYIIKNGYVSHEYYASVKKKNKDIGEILKIVDSVMRQMYSYHKSISLAKAIKVYFNIIEKEVNNFCIENGKMNLHLLIKKGTKKKLSEIKTPPAPIVIDPRKFSEIRAISHEIQNKLIVDEEQSENTMFTVCNPEPIKETESQNTLLTQSELEILKEMIDKNINNYQKIIKTNGLILSVVIDTINEKLFDLFHDNCIELDGEIPVIITDYEDELKGLLSI